MAKGKKKDRVLIAAYEVRVYEDSYDVTLENPENLTARHVEQGVLHVMNTIGEFRGKQVRAKRVKEAEEATAKEMEKVDG